VGLRGPGPGRPHRCHPAGRSSHRQGDGRRPPAGPVTGAAAFTLGGRVYLAGGRVWQGRARGGPPGAAGPGLVTSGEVFAFDPARDALTVAGRLPVPVANAAAAVVGGTASLAGGNNGHRHVPTVTAF